MEIWDLDGTLKKRGKEEDWEKAEGEGGGGEEEEGRGGGEEEEEGMRCPCPWRDDGNRRRRRIHSSELDGLEGERPAEDYSSPMKQTGSPHQPTWEWTSHSQQQHCYGRMAKT
jgi:hypothetical protein